MSITVYPLKIDLETFQRIPENERLFIVQLGWLCNDLMLLQKLLVCMNNNDVATPEKVRGNSSMILTIKRFMAGRLVEGWKMLGTSFFGTGVSREYEPLLEEQGKKALQSLKEYFSGQNILKSLRDTFCFHSDPDEVRRALGLVDQDMDLSIYLSQSQGNSLYWFADEIVGRGMTSGISGVSETEALNKIFDDCLNMSGQFLQFAGYCMIVMGQRHLDVEFDDLRERAITVDNLQQLSDILFPFFVATNDDERA